MEVKFGSTYCLVSQLKWILYVITFLILIVSGKLLFFFLLFARRVLEKNGSVPLADRVNVLWF